MIAGLVLAAILSAAETPRQAVERVFSRVEALEARQFNQDARAVRELDRQIEALKPEIVALGGEAVAPLSGIAGDAKRSEKTRLWALSFLALTRDPGSLNPLKSALYDAKTPPLLRAEAAAAVPGLDLGSAAKRGVLCDALKLELPPDALRQTLFALSRLGCDETSGLETRALEYGSTPSAKQAPLVGYAAAALGVSKPVGAARTLWRLFDFFAKRSPQRLAVLQALLAQRENQRVFEKEALGRAQDALLSESEAPANAIAAARLLASFDDEAAAPLLLRFLKNKDAEVVAECAEALARLKANEAKAPLRKILDEVASDPRFAPIPGKPEPRELVSRIQKALDSLPKAP
ncbi:MAG: HEAT repeat domain-containing protein [Elusimicrobia bacterium]|nr:HEAT repeat domain-containing protein [Elusimicrobiota bacterium]